MWLKNESIAHSLPHTTNTLFLFISNTTTCSIVFLLTSGFLTLLLIPTELLPSIAYPVRVVSMVAITSLAIQSITYCALALLYGCIAYIKILSCVSILGQFKCVCSLYNSSWNDEHNEDTCCSFPSFVESGNILPSKVLYSPSHCNTWKAFL